MSQRIRELKDIRCLGAAEIEANRLQRLRRVVAHAKANSPFYDRLYRDIDPETCNLPELPTTDKALLVDNFDDAVTDPRLRLNEIRDWIKKPVIPGAKFESEFTLLRSSGTTGQGGYFAYSQAEMATIGAHNSLGSKWRGPGLLDIGSCVFPGKKFKTATVVSLQGVATRVQLAHRFGAVSNYLFERKFIDISNPIKSIIHELNTFNPHCLISVPSMLEILAQEQLAGKLRLKPKLIRAFGESLAPHSRTFTEDTFGCRVRNVYGVAENFLVALECDKRQMHAFSDLIFLEPVDRDGSPTTPGQTSHGWLLTCLERFVQPIIRYEIEDSIVILDAPCACGHPSSTIEIIGRTEETFVVPRPSGETVRLVPKVILMQAEGVTGTRSFQIRQEARDHIRVLIVPKMGAQPSTVQREIQHNFERLLSKHSLSGHVKLEVVVTQHIARTAGGKFQKLVNLSSAGGQRGPRSCAL